MVLPVDPAPGFGGLLLGSIVAAHLPGIDDDLVPDIHRLIGQVERGERIVQPRLRHRFQVDRHGLAVSRHRLVGARTTTSRFDFHTIGTDLAQVLGAIYAAERLAPEYRRQIGPLLQKAARWRGPIGSALIAHLAGSQTLTLEALADPRGWAMGILGFELGGKAPSKREVTAQFRIRMRDVHPDHGGAEHRRGQGDERPRRGPPRAVDEAGLIERIDERWPARPCCSIPVPGRAAIIRASCVIEADARSSVDVQRHDFPYRREGRKAPDRAPKLMASIRDDLAAIGRRRGPVVMGGRSMGGRMTTMVAADVDGGGPVARLAGLVLICYPLHPPGKPDNLRVEHLPAIDGAVPVHLGHERPVRYARRTRTVDGHDPRPGRRTCGSSARATTSRGPTPRSPTPPRLRRPDHRRLITGRQVTGRSRG